MSKLRVASSIWLLCLLNSVIIACFLQKAQVAALTDPNEGKIFSFCSVLWFFNICFSSITVLTQFVIFFGVIVRVISSLAEKWNIESSETWNLTDPCSGPANSTADIENENPAIKCSCTEATCHVTQMYVTIIFSNDFVSWFLSKTFTCRRFE